ncbi:MAG: type III polyketide synthase [Vicinamibacteria bacterium]
MRIVSVGRAFPENYYPQSVLSEALKKHWAKRHFNLDRLDQLHRNVLVDGRHLALTLEEYEALDSFTATNDAFIRKAVDVGARAIEDALSRAGIEPLDVHHLFFASTTGVATPSIDARIVNRLGLRRDIKRTPLFGLGCVAGAVGITRASDYLKAYPGEAAILLSVELCSLTLQRTDLSIPNIVATGLFGDGAAAVTLVGEDRETSVSGPKVIATRSVFYRDTERVMGWDITKDGFAVVLSAEIPSLVRREVRRDVDGFLDSRGLTLRDIEVFVCHPGGPKILDAFAEALDLPRAAFEITWESLKRVGNLSSASVLMILGDTLDVRTPPPGTYGLLMAMGPGFCSELVLLQW